MSRFSACSSSTTFGPFSGPEIMLARDLHEGCRATDATGHCPTTSTDAWCSRSMEPAMHSLTPFHIAFPVDDLDAARHFYGTVLGCPEGRSSNAWIDFNLFGHQIVAHRVAT